MSIAEKNEKIPEEQLAEYWFGLRHVLFRDLKAAFRQTNLTQEDIAARLSCHPSLISRRLNGKENMTMRTMNNMARAIDCRLTVVLEALKDLPMTNAQALHQEGHVTTAGSTKAESAIFAEFYFGDDVDDPLFGPSTETLGATWQQSVDA